MKDLTQGSINAHLVSLAAPFAVGMLVQTAYQMVDLYFITRLGVTATAGVNAATNITLAFAALMQIISVGTAPLVAQHAGRKDRDAANIVFNQSLTASVLLGVAMAFVLYISMPLYLPWLAADAATADAGEAFLCGLLPGLALLLPTAALGAALRAIGIVRSYVIISSATVMANAALAPVLIAGWGTGIPLGARGAGLATTLSIILGSIAFIVYFRRNQRYLSISLELLKPDFSQCYRIFSIGVPASLELILIFFSTAFLYYVVRDFGAAVQAGLGVGLRILHMVLLPGMAIGFAAGPIAAQSFGAGNHERVKQTFYQASLLCSAVRLAVMGVVQWQTELLVELFDADGGSAPIAVVFLQGLAWTCIAQGLIYVCTNIFQSLGSSVTPLASSALRFMIFTVAIGWLSAQPEFGIEDIVQVWILSTMLQAIGSIWLLRRQFQRQTAAPAALPLQS
jgi:putative MATE family efflux protein